MTDWQKNFLLTILIFLILSYPLIELAEEWTTKSFERKSTTQTSTSSTPVTETPFTLTKKYQFDDRLGIMKDIFVKDNYAYVAVSWGGLVIFDISDLIKPVVTGCYSHTGLTSGVFIQDEIAFLADGRNGLLILNISNPKSIIKLGNFSILGGWDFYIDIYVVKNYAYVLSSSNSFIVFDISNVSSPIKLSEIEFKGSTFFDILVKNDIVFLGGSRSKVVNVTNPADPQLLMSFNNTYAFAIHEDALLVTTGNRVLIYNFSSLPTLELLANLTLPLTGSAEYLCTNTKIAYIGSTEEIIALNISDIINPQYIAKISNLNWFYTIDSIWIDRKLATFEGNERNDIVLFTDYQRGLFIYNISKIANSLVGYYDSGMRTERVQVKGNYVYVSSRPELPYYPSKFEIYKYTDNSLAKIGSYFSSAYICDFAITENIAFLAAGHGVEVLDLSNLNNPINIGTYTYASNPFPCWNLFYDEHKELLYLCCDIEGLVILNATNPANLTLISQVSDLQGYGYRAYDVYVAGDYAFVSDVQMFGGFGILNVSDPWNPAVVTYIPMNHGMLGVQVQNNLTYLTSYWYLLEIFDVANVSDPIEIGQYDEHSLGSSTGNFFIQGDTYFVARQESFTLINISTPTNPQEIISIKSPRFAYYIDVFIKGSLLFVTCAWGGLEIWQLPIPNQSMVRLKELLYTILSLFSCSLFIVTILIYRQTKKEF